MTRALRHSVTHYLEHFQDVLAAAASATLQVDIAPDAMDGQLPAVLVTVVKGVAGDRAEKVLGTMSTKAATFDQAWTAYQARKDEIAAIVERSAALRAEGKTAEARTLLASAIGEAARYPDRTKRPVLPTDAELAAIGALAEIMGAEDRHAPPAGIGAAAPDGPWTSPIWYEP